MQFTIIISTWALKELFGLSKIDSAKMFFELAKNKIKKVPYSSDPSLTVNIFSSHFFLFFRFFHAFLGEYLTDNLSSVTSVF